MAFALWTLAAVTLGRTLVLHFLLPETGQASLEDIGRNVTTSKNTPALAAVAVAEGGNDGGRRQPG